MIGIHFLLLNYEIETLFIFLEVLIVVIMRSI